MPEHHLKTARKSQWAHQTYHTILKTFDTDLRNLPLDFLTSALNQGTPIYPLCPQMK